MAGSGKKRERVRLVHAAEEEKGLKISKAEEELFRILDSSSPGRGSAQTGELPLLESAQKKIEPIEEVEREETTFSLKLESEGSKR